MEMHWMVEFAGQLSSFGFPLGLNSPPVLPTSATYLQSPTLRTKIQFLFCTSVTPSGTATIRSLIIQPAAASTE